MTLAEPKNEKQNRALFYKLLNWGATWGGAMNEAKTANVKPVKHT